MVYRVYRTLKLHLKLIPQRSATDSIRLCFCFIHAVDYYWANGAYWSSRETNFSFGSWWSNRPLLAKTHRMSQMCQHPASFVAVSWSQCLKCLRCENLQEVQGIREGRHLPANIDTCTVLWLTGFSNVIRFQRLTYIHYFDWFNMELLKRWRDILPWSLWFPLLQPDPTLGIHLLGWQIQAHPFHPAHKQTS